MPRDKPCRNSKLTQKRQEIGKTSHRERVSTGKEIVRGGRDLLCRGSFEHFIHSAHGHCQPLRTLSEGQEYTFERRGGFARSARVQPATLSCSQPLDEVPFQLTSCHGASKIPLTAAAMMPWYPR